MFEKKTNSKEDEHMKKNAGIILNNLLYYLDILARDSDYSGCLQFLRKKIGNGYSFFENQIVTALGWAFEGSDTDVAEFILPIAAEDSNQIDHKINVFHDNIHRKYDPGENEYSYFDDARNVLGYKKIKVCEEANDKRIDIPPNYALGETMLIMLLLLSTASVEAGYDKFTNYIHEKLPYAAPYIENFIVNSVKALLQDEEFDIKDYLKPVIEGNNSITKLLLTTLEAQYLELDPLENSYFNVAQNK